MPRIKHKKGPRRRQAAWGPPSVAKRIGRDWTTMSTEDRNLLSDTCRFFYRQRHTFLKYRLTVSLDTPEDFSYSDSATTIKGDDMDNNTTNAKASKVLKALAQVESELRAEGQTKDADNIHKGLGELTVGSLVRLHDLLVTHETKAEALKSLGIDA